MKTSVTDLFLSFVSDLLGVFPRCLFVVLAVGGLALADQAVGQTLIVDSPSDVEDGDISAGNLSLREAIDLANTTSADVIEFDPGLANSTITLTEGDLEISSSVTINGLGADVLTISGGGASRVFEEVGSGPRIITIRDLTLADGVAPSGGGGALFTNGGTITLERVVMRNHSSLGNDGSTILAAFATLDIIECAIVDNLTLGVGALRLQDCQTTITSSTIANNQTRGISLFSASNSSDDTLSLTNVTIFGNDNDGIEIVSAAGTKAIFDYQNTIFAENVGTNIEARVTGDAMLITGEELTITSLGNNLLDDTPAGDAAHAAAGGDLRDTDPMLAPLGNYGGTTPTKPPLPGSLAIEGGAVVAGVDGDQRGFPIAGVPDIGAVEDQEIPGFPLTVVSSTDDNFDGITNGVSLREALAFTPPGGTVTFDPVVSGATIPFVEEFVIDKDLVVDASSLSGGLAMDGGFTTRLFQIASGRSVEMIALTFANGDADMGGAFHNEGVLTLSRCTLVGNFATMSGGAIHNVGDLVVENCTLSGNATTQGGGIFNASPGEAEVVQSTLSENNVSVEGGGIFNTGTLTLQQSVIAGNSAPAGPDLRNSAPMITRIGVNFIGDVAGSGLVADVDLLTGDPMLGMLSDNGGPTLTYAPPRGSPLIDPAGGLTSSPFATDQRGFVRVSRGIVDIGAVEDPIVRPVLFAPRRVKAKRNGRAVIRGSAENAILVRFKVAGQRGVNRTAGSTERWVARVSKLKRRVTRVRILAFSIDGVRTVEVVKVKKAKVKRRK